MDLKEVYEIYKQDPDVYYLLEKSHLLIIRTIAKEQQKTYEERVKNLTSMGFKDMTKDDHLKAMSCSVIYQITGRILEKYHGVPYVER